MSRFLLLLLVFVSVAQVRAEEDEVTSSPHGTFRIVQHRQEDVKQTFRFSVKQTLYFIREPSRVILLEYDISWPAIYYISPDEHWILRIQKSGSGDNISFLYQLDAQGRLWRMEEQIGALGFAYLAKQPGVPGNLYHTGIEFESWNLKAGLLHFTISGSDAEQSGNGVRRSLTYNLRKQMITSP